MSRRSSCRLGDASRGGFTLVELLIVISIIGILVGILLPALQTARESAGMVRELSLGRQLGVAYELYSQEHNGELLQAYSEQREGTLKTPAGDVITGEARKRWVWWLAPYFSDDMRVLIRDEKELDRVVSELGSDLGDGTLSVYAASVFPRFGLNHYYVGGRPEYYSDDRYREIWGSAFWVDRMSEEERPWQRISFTTAAFQQGSIFIPGYYKVDPPSFLTSIWQSLDPPTAQSRPEDTGHVWPDERNRVVSVLLDGHAEAMEWSEITDMRRWAPQADDSDWKMPAITR